MRSLVSLAAAMAFLAPVPAASASSAPAGGPAPEHVVLAVLQAYMPSNNVTIKQGESILFVDADPTAGPGHSFTEDVPEGETPRFDSDIVPPGTAREVPNVSSLEPGTYKVRCRIHVIVSGSLTVG